MGISIGLGIGIPAGYPEGGGTNPQTYYILSELGEYINEEAAANALMITENSP